MILLLYALVEFLRSLRHDELCEASGTESAQQEGRHVPLELLARSRHVEGVRTHEDEAVTVLRPSAIQNTLSAWLPGDDRRHKRATANGDDDRLGVLHNASPFRVDAQDDRDKATPAQTPEGLKAGRHYM